MTRNALNNDERLRVLIPEDRLQARIKELGAQIRADFGDRPITCIGVLKGSFIFMADLVRAIGGDVRCEFLGVSSYQGGTQSTGVVKITKPKGLQLLRQLMFLLDSGRN